MPPAQGRERRDRVHSKTHLARVDLLTAERVVVGTHLGCWRCAAGLFLSIGVGWLSRIGLLRRPGRETDTIVVRRAEPR